MVADTVAVVIADGHGTSKHADIGARLAVHVALTALVRFAEDLGERASNLIEVQKYAEHPLRVQIVREWKERVHAKAGDGETPLVDYGSTLLVALATPDFLLVGQLGDGDILLVNEDGTVDVPLPADPEAFADETPSLCLPEAEHSFRLRVLPTPKQETLLLLSTDGYSKSYPTDAAFKQIGPDYLDLIRKDGVAKLTLDLRGFLEAVTNQGSGDDIALALLHWSPPDSPAALADGEPPIENAEIEANPTAKKGESSLPGETEASESQVCESARVSPPDAAMQAPSETEPARTEPDTLSHGKLGRWGWVLRRFRGALRTLSGNKDENSK